VSADAPGYRLVISPDQVDATRFTRLVADGRKALARGDAGEAERISGDDEGVVSVNGVLG
jgi:hypothetical protein